MFENFIFSGYGFSVGDYKVENTDIDKAISDGFFSGLDKQRIEQSDNYKLQKSKNPELSPFDYLAEHKMGFRCRYHVVPFPPRKKSYDTAKNALDLLTNAIEQALEDSGVHPEDIDAWIMGTATPVEMAPGIAETVKAYFCKIDNRTQTMTTTSACVGFNINVERAINYFKSHPEAKHIVIGHTEVMSSLLLEEHDFVPFTTFGDGAAAVVISRTEGEKKEGVVEVVNYEDMSMIDFLGSDRRGNLIMEPRVVKSRAVPNIANSAGEILEKSGWSKEETDLFIPHQTGNAIVLEATDMLDFPLDKVFQDIQYDFGNLSGASVPASMAYLSQKGRLRKGMKILTAVAGLGGEFGGFSYIVPEKQKKRQRENDLEGKTALVTGCSGGLGGEVARQLAQKGCRVLMQYNSNTEKAEELLQTLANKQLNHLIVKADFSSDNDIKELADFVMTNTIELNYLIHTVAVTGSLGKASEITDEEMVFVDKVNYVNTAKLTTLLTPILKETVIFTGSIAQDAQFPGSSAYVSSKRALYAFAMSYAREHYLKIKTVYYIPGIIDGGMTAVLNEAQVNASMQAVGQDKLIPLEDISSRVVKSLYIPKVAGVRNEYDGVLVVRKDGYNKF